MHHGDPSPNVPARMKGGASLMPHAVFGMPASPEWMIQRAREEAAKAGPFSARIVAEVAPLMGWIPAPPTSAERAA